MDTEHRERYLSWLALFASTGTLICCALPIVFVALGFGAAVAALSSNFSFLVTVSLHKAWVFAASGGLLALSGWFIFRPGRSCRPDTELGELCENTTHGNQRIFWVSLAIWAVGFCAGYLVLPLRIWLGI